MKTLTEIFLHRIERIRTANYLDYENFMDIAIEQLNSIRDAWRDGMISADSKYYLIKKLYAAQVEQGYLPSYKSKSFGNHSSKRYNGGNI